MRLLAYVIIMYLLPVLLVSATSTFVTTIFKYELNRKKKKLKIYQVNMDLSLIQKMISIVKNLQKDEINVPFIQNVA